MSYQEIARADCTFWKGYRPCDKQREQGLPNCAGCALYEKAQEVLSISNKLYMPDMLRGASSVGIIEMGGLGSILRTTAVSKRIKEMNPEAKVYWFTHARGIDLLRYVPNVSPIDIEVGQIPRASLKMDVLVNFEISDVSKEIVLQNECIAGFGVNNQGKFLGVAPYAENFQRLQIDDAFRKENSLFMQQILLESIGLEYRGLDYDIQLTPDNYKSADEILKQELKGEEFTQLIGVNIGTSRKGFLKRWPPYRHAELIGNLANTHPDKGILVLSGPEDADAREGSINEMVSQGVKGKNIAVLPNNIEIGNFMALIDRCSVLVTADTFAFQAAQALKTPTVVLAGPKPHKELEVDTGSILIGPKLECSPCYYRCIQPVDGQCMIDIQEQEVRDAVNNLILN